MPPPSTWRHLVAPVPVFEITRAVVEAVVAEREVVVAFVKKALVPVRVEAKKVVEVPFPANRVVEEAVVVNSEVVVAFAPTRFATAVFASVVEPVTKRLRALR